MTQPDYTVDQLVLDVKNDYVSPSSQSLFTDEDVVRHLDSSLKTHIVPLIRSVREDYYTTIYDQAVTGAASYTVPRRSASGALLDVTFVDPSGNEIELTQLSTKQIKATFPWGYQLPLYTFGYYIQDDQVILYPQQARVATGYTLRMRYLRSPNDLTLSTNCAQIMSIVGNDAVVNNIDSTWTTASVFDVIQNYPQFRSIKDDLTITGINTGTNTITLSSAPTGIAAGMWLCPAYTSCIAQMPYQFYDLLVAVGAEHLARAIGDSMGTQLAEKHAEELKKNFLKMIDPRVDGGRKVIFNRNQGMGWGNRGSAFMR